MDNQPTDNLREKAVKGVAWSAVQKWGNQVISFGVFFVLARLLQPEDFGLVAMAAVFTAFIQIFLDQGLSQAIVQRADLQPDHLDTAFWVSILTGGLLTIIGILLSGIIARIFDEPRLQPVVAWMSLTFFLASLTSTQMAILQRELNFKVLATRTLLASLCGGVVGMTAAWLGYGVWSLIAKELVGAAVGVIVLWRVSSWRPGWRVSTRHFNDLFGFGINLVGIRVLSFLNQRSDDFLIGYFLGPTALGYYAVAYRLIFILVSTVTGITESVTFSTFSRLQQQPERLRQAYYQVIEFTALFSFPTFIGLALLAPQVVPIVFGEQWLPSVSLLQILAFAGLVITAMNPNGSVLYAMGKPSWVFGLMLVGTIVNICGFIVVVQHGVIAVAAVFAFVQYGFVPVWFYLMHRALSIKLTNYIKLFLTPLVGSLTLILLTLIFRYFSPNGLSSFWSLILSSIAGGGIYLLIIKVTKPTLLFRLHKLILVR